MTRRDAKQTRKITSEVASIKIAQKLCCNCSRPAQFSMVVIISTVGVRKRLQKSSRAVLFCDSCLQESCDHLQSIALRECVNEALTSLNLRLYERATAANDLNL
jgi:hypothetical protein